MIIIKKKNRCCGCEACVQVCPKHCISFEEDAEGFRYPKVYVSSCVNCGLCEKVCPFLNQSAPQLPLASYAARNRDPQELDASSSGGAFVLLAQEIIKQNGVVFGAKFDADWNVVHGYAETLEDLKAFMGSKYVQSRIGNSYVQAKTFLKAGRKVLFSGTTCQIAGLKRILGKDYDNLVSVDVICHGVPSPKVWQMYLDYVKNKAGNASITNISFRDKRLGWKKFSLVISLDYYASDGIRKHMEIADYHRDNPFMQAFLANLILRPSCGKCKVKGGRCHSDITLADFWGVWNILPQANDNRGTTLLLANSSRGSQMLKSVNWDLKEVDFMQAIQSNHAFQRSAIIHPNRNKFFKQLSGADALDMEGMQSYSKTSVSLKLKAHMLIFKIRIARLLSWKR